MLWKTCMSLLPEAKSKAMQIIWKNEIKVLILILILWRRYEFL